MKPLMLPWFFLVMLFLQGCTTFQLTRSTLAEGKTMTDLQYTMVLDNVAMFRDDPDHCAVPWHLTFSSGDVTIKDTLSAGNPSLSYAWDPISRVFGGSAMRSWQENWTAAPIVDRPTLERLAKIYKELAAATNMIYSGRGFRDEAASGYYNDTRVWVSRTNLEYLTSNTIVVLSAASGSGLPGGPAGASTTGTLQPYGHPFILPGPTPSIR